MTTKPNTFSLPLNHKGVFTAAMVARSWLDLCSVGQAQNITIEGQVTSAEREPTGFATDLGSRYSIVAAHDDTLVFSYIGYETVAVPIDARSGIDAALTFDVNVLNCSDVTGSVVGLDESLIVNTPRTS